LNVHDQIVLAFNTYLKEMENFEKNEVKIAATRARIALLDLSKLIPSRRKELLESKKEIKGNLKVD